MRKEHDVLPPISSDRPIDETIHRGFVDAAAQNSDMPINTSVARARVTLVLLTRR